MAVMTKSVFVEYTIDHTDEWLEQTGPKLLQMTGFGKTDNVRYNQLTEPRFGSERHFVDQAAAEEWLSFVTAMSSTLNRPIVSSSITDI